MDTNGNGPLRDLFRILPIPILMGAGAGILVAVLARLALPLLLTILDADVPLGKATGYMAFVVAWSPYPIALITFAYFAWRAWRRGKNDSG